MHRTVLQTLHAHEKKFMRVLSECLQVSEISVIFADAKLEGKAQIFKILSF